MTHRIPRSFLIVEDEFMIAEWLRENLEMLGHAVGGVAANVQAGLKLAGDLAVDGAIVDLNLDGARSYPVVDVLLDKDIPVIISTAYYPLNLPVRYRNCPILQKPYDNNQLSDVLTRLWPA